MNWTSRSTGTTNSLNSIAYGSGKWMAVGVNNTLVTSTNGIGWIPQQLSPADVHYLDVVYANGQFVMVGIDGKIYTSGKNNHWVKPYSPTKNHLASITHGNGLFMAVGAVGSVVTSIDDDGPIYVEPEPTGPKCTQCRTTFDEIANGESARPEVAFQAITYPNPVDDRFSVKIEGAKGGKVRMLLIDTSGRTLLDKLVTTENGIYEEAVSMSQRQTGIYLFRVSTSTQTQTLKILKR